VLAGNGFTTNVIGFAFASDPEPFPPGLQSAAPCTTSTAGTAVRNASGSLIGYVFCTLETADNNGDLIFDATTPAGNDFGVRLVSDFEVVPEAEPSTLAILVVGLAGLGFVRRRRAA